jgi:hypothetical protein
MRLWIAGIFAAIALLAAAATAEAAPIAITSVTPAQLLADFNVITDANLANSNDINGPVLVGCPASGCLASTGLQSNGPLNSSSVVLGSTAGTTAITGYGEVDVSGNVLAGTNASVMGSVTYIGGADNGTLSSRGAGSVLGGYAFPPGTSAANNPATFQSSIWAPLTGVSANLAGLAPTYTVTSTTFDGIPNTNGVAVLSVSLNMLNHLSGQLNFTGCLSSTNPGGPCAAVIDVTGAGTLSQGFEFPVSSLAHGLPNVIVNFADDVTVDVSNVWTASILDPLGAVVASHDLTGNVVALSYSNNQETHLPGFDCADGLCMCPPGFPGCSFAAPRIPEPGSLAVLGFAVGALVVTRRRRVGGRELGCSATD